MVHVSGTRIWRGFRCTTKCSFSDMLLLFPLLQAACPRILQFQLKDSRGELTSGLLTMGTLLLGLEKPVSIPGLVALLAPNVAISR